jgi:osmotically-inducible protein OsmY
MSPFRVLPVFAVLSVLAGCAAEESCKDHPCTPDQTLVEAVTANIHSHAALLADHLRVQSEDGTVYLYGLVATNVELVEVEEVAKATPGVKRVVNMCAIENVQR